MKQSSFWQKTKAVHFNNADLKSETKQKKTFLAHLYAAVKKSFYNAAASFTFRTLPKSMAWNVVVSTFGGALC